MVGIIEYFKNRSAQKAEESRKKKFHEEFKYRDELVRKEFEDYDFCGLSNSVINNLLYAAESGSIVSLESRTGELMKEEDLTQQHINDALIVYNKLRPTFLLNSISKHDGEFHFEHPYYEEVQDLHSQGRLKIEDLEGAIKKMLNNEARGFYKLAMVQCPDHANPEAIIYGINNGEFSEEELSILERKLDHGEDLAEFNKCYGHGVEGKEKRVAERLLSYKKEKKVEHSSAVS